MRQGVTQNRIRQRHLTDEHNTVATFSSIVREVRRPFQYIARWVPGLVGLPKRLLTAPLPKRVAIFLFIFQITLVVVACICFRFSKAETEFGSYFSFKSLLFVITMLFAIPVLAYVTLKLWLEGDLSQYPDIDSAWQAGLEALGERGYDIAELPLFLVIGVPDEVHVDNLMRASGIKFQVESTPTGLSPLRWYANDDGIFLSLVNTGCLGCVNENAGGTPPGAPSLAGASPTAPDSVTGTMIAGGGATMTPAASAQAEPVDAGVPITGTLMPGGIGGTLVSGMAVLASQSAMRPQVSNVNRQRLDEESARLKYVCELLRRARQPLCSHNGMLTVLPLASVRNILTAKDVPEAIRRDLSAIREATQLVSASTVLVTGMEDEFGFSELVRRVGASRAKSSRFGKGFNVWNTPSSENLEAVASDACGAFEDWVYALFKEEDGFNKPGNGKLFSLLCSIRSQLRARVKNILMKGFSNETRDGGREDEPELFGGCYFAATGSSSDRQAFVRSALDKVMQLEEDLEWTEAATIEENRFRRMVTIGTFVNLFLILCLIGLVINYAINK